MKSNRFRVQNGLFSQNDIVYGKTIQLIFMYLLASFTMQISKKSFRVDPELWRHAIFRPKCPILPNW